MAGSRKASRSAKGARSRGSSNGRSTQAFTSTEQLDPAPTTTRSQERVVARRRPVLKYSLIGVAVAALLLIGGGLGFAYWTVQKALPTINGTIKMAGLSAPVTITRDTNGIPHITAANVEDLYAAQGYVHAQDRLFQMYQLRAAGYGRVSEAFGKSFVNLDRFLRTVGFSRAAEAELAQMDPKVRSGLEAYARGVNEFIHTHADALPLEFNLQGLKMEDWTALDSVTFGKLQAWDLTDSWDDDLMMADLSAKLGPDRAAQLVPGYPDDAPAIVPGGSSGQYLPALQAYSRYVRPYLPNFGLSELGSNNWVIDGTKSTTGKPLLANDPHLGVRNPSIWYQVHLTTTDGKYDATGFGFASAPGIVTGHNKDIAWGVTNTGTDVQDVFIETLDPKGHPDQYKSGDQWYPLQVVTETIKVAGGEPVTQTVRITGHGPILSDAFVLTPTVGSSIGSQIYSLQWTGLKPGRLMEAVYGLQTASNWEEFRAALSKWTVPGQNFVYADRLGNIGYQMTGDVPIRRQKGGANRPVSGAGGLYDWVGTIPFDDLPRAYNPPEHFIATANNRPFGPDYERASGQEIPGGWSYPWRISRITEMLKAKEKLGADDFKAMLMDTQSVLARKVAPIIAGLEPEGDAEKKAVALFQGWNGDIKADSAAAAIYEVVSQHAVSQTLSDDLGEELYEEYISTNGGAARRTIELLLDKPEDPLWDRAGTVEKEGRDDILLKSLTTALADLKAVLGEDMGQWQWGKIHRLVIAHPFGSQEVLAGVFNLPAVQMAGDSTTVAVAPPPLDVPFASYGNYPLTNHQSYRMIIDLSDWSKSQSIYATGQSGQPFAKHWGDMLTKWHTGEYNPMLYTTQEIEANKEGVLTLTP